ncbi:MAG: hypothetical protein LBT79_02530 [Elusimicrobiota bacterium]|jgi:hypothetical protein|nr:hypothetical protein [Elusimicrobiota bacterium]
MKTYCGDKCLFCSSCSIPLRGRNASLRNSLAGELINLAQVALSVTCDKTMSNAILDGLAVMDTNVCAEESSFVRLINQTIRVRNSHGYTCCFQSREIRPFDMNEIRDDDKDVSSLKFLILDALSGMASHARLAGSRAMRDEIINNFFYKALTTLAGTLTPPYLADIALELGSVNLRCMELLAGRSESAALKASDSPALSIAKGVLLAGGCKERDGGLLSAITSLPNETALLTFGCCHEPNGIHLGSPLAALDFIQSYDAAPIKLIYAWYGSRSAALLLTFISMGIKEIYAGPFPDFFSAETKDLLGLKEISELTM